MENTLFVIIASFLPLSLLSLFAEGNSSMAQPQQGQPQRGDSSSQGLETCSLPAGTITEKDMPQIKTVIQQVLGRISESKKPAGKRADNQTIRSGILAFQGWLKRQGCISQASTSYDIEATDKYSDNIFFTYPGQLPFDIVFKMEGDIKRHYRLLIFVTAVDLFNLASLVENKSVNGVPALKNWPSSYLEKRPEGLD